jgi:hypothetical protein
MKNAVLFIVVFALSSLVFLGCQDQSRITNPQDSVNKSMSSILNSPISGTSYDISLVDGYPQMVNGKQEWLWKIVNTGSSQDLSHWDFVPPVCVQPDDIFYAGFGLDPASLTSVPIEFKVDKSQDCYTGPVLKFNFGTSGTTPSYYKIILNEEFAQGTGLLVYKSGAQTGCGTSEFPGIGCGGIITEYQSETAWGQGPRFVERGNWAMYFMFPAGETEVTVDLIAGKQYEAGEVTVTRNGAAYEVTYTSTSPWLFSEFHFAYGDYVILGKNPAPGRFPLKAEFGSSYATTHTFNFIGPEGNPELKLAAHCVVVKPLTTKTSRDQIY